MTMRTSHAALVTSVVGIALAATSAAAADPSAATATADRPNIVCILGDDIGYTDFGCYGATKIKTPEVDRLAAQGIRFTDAYAPSALCTPTRYSVITGEYAWRGASVWGVLNGDEGLIIRPGTMTVASLLKQAGYATGIVGKWHLGLGPKKTGPDYNGQLKPGPLEVGFDSWFGYAVPNDHVPLVYIEDHRVVNVDPKDPIRIADAGKFGPVIDGQPRWGQMTGGKAARWKDDEMAAVLNGKALEFIERHKDRLFFLYYATRNVHTPVTPGGRFRGTSQAGIVGDDVQEFDWTVGQVVATLERLGLTQKTLLIVTSDNGATPVRRSELAAFGHTAFGPLRGAKATIYEGGTRMPFIARWPGKIKPGQVSHQMISLADLLATCAAIVGRDLPHDAGPDSFNVLPALLDASLARPIRNDLIIDSALGKQAIREGDWKFIPPGPKAGPELYNLKQDIGEARNVAAEHLKIVQHLSELLAKQKAAGRSVRD